MAVQIKEKNLIKTLPDLLIEILANGHSFRIRDIHAQLKRNYNIKISFQAVRKALNILVDQGKLNLDKNEYLINKSWIKENKRISDTLIQNYFVGELKDKPPKVSSIGEEFQIYQFENSLQTDKFLGELLLDIASKKGKKKLCIQTPHYWYFLGHLGTESDFLQQMYNKGTKLYYLASENTFLDKLAEKFYKSHKVKFKIIKENFEDDTELIIIGDFIIKIKYSRKFVRKINNLFKKTKNFEHFGFLEFGKLIKAKLSVNLTLFKDKALAENVRESTLKYFKNKN